MNLPKQDIQKTTLDINQTSKDLYTKKERAEIEENLKFTNSKLSPLVWESEAAWFSVMEWSRAITKCRHCKNEENCSSNSRGYVPTINYIGNISYRPCRRYIEFLEQKKNESILSLANIPTRYKTMTFSNMDNSNKSIVDFAKEVANKNTDMGLVLTGGTGVGKTHIAVSIAKEYLDLRKGTVAFYSCPKLRQDMNEVNDYSTFAKRMEHCLNADLLILDDLGAEGYSDAWGRYLYQIIDSRHINVKPYVITTNLSLAELSKKMGLQGERLISRMREDCKVAEMKGKDRRI